MTDKLRWVVTLIACSLLGVFLLQVYFGYQVYQQHALRLEKETYTALEKAVKAADKNRIDDINSLFAQAIRNPEVVELKYALEKGEPRIFVIDPQTENIHVSIKIRKEIDSTIAVSELAEELINYNRTFLEEGSIMYWTDEIGEMLVRNVDSIQLIKSTVAEEVRRELDNISINGSFQLLLSNDSIETSSTLTSALFRRKVAAKIEGFNSVSIRLDHPATEIFKRTGFVFFMTAVVLLLIVGCFVILLKLIGRLKELSQLKDDFIDNVTHELLTPITTLKLALASLRQQEAWPTGNKYLDISEQQAQRIAEVTDHILQVSFVDGKNPGLKLEPIKINDLLNEVLTYHQVTATKPFEVVTAFGQGEVVLSDRNHLQNVFHNLVGNAVKYAPEAGVVLRVSIKQKAGCLEITFTDDGIGIPAGERERIFEKFHRITNHITHEVKGLGIGLYYARKILRQLNGDLTLQVDTTKGTTFCVVLPALTTTE